MLELVGPSVSYIGPELIVNIQETKTSTATNIP